MRAIWHYKATCVSCSTILSGRPPDLRTHKEQCVQMPENVRNTVSATKEPSSKRVAQQTITKCFAETVRSQEDSDYLLGMALITGDIPYR